MDSIDALILGIVEGITEFLPISSTGHLMVANSLLHLSQNNDQEFINAFTVAIQFGAILAVVILYFQRFFRSLDFYYKLFIGFLPIGILGFIFEKKVDEMLSGIMIVAWSFLIGGIILLFVDNWFKETEESPDKEVKYGNAFLIGCFQAIALIPGVSRSAATIVGGLTQKLNRKTAVEFSFFLAVPTMFAATAYELLKARHEAASPREKELPLLRLRRRRTAGRLHLHRSRNRTDERPQSAGLPR